MSAENPADIVIEQFIAEEFAFQPASEVPLQAQRLRIRLHDAGLLADPADRDVKARLIAQRNVLRRMRRAEAEVARLQRWKDEASPVMIGLQDLGRALGIPLGTHITSEAAAEKARTLNAEVAELRAMRDRVRELADEAPTVPVHAGGGNLVSNVRMVSTVELRAALDGGEQ